MTKLPISGAFGGVGVLLEAGERHGGHASNGYVGGVVGASCQVEVGVGGLEQGGWRAPGEVDGRRGARGRGRAEAAGIDEFDLAGLGKFEDTWWRW